MYDGPERRKNGNGDIEIHLVKLKVKFDERWKAHDQQADDRQKATCQKLDDIKQDIVGIKINAIALDKTATILMGTINERLATLPCKERAGFYRSFTNQIKVLWGFVVAIVLLIVGEWVKKK